MLINIVSNGAIKKPFYKYLRCMEYLDFAAYGDDQDWCIHLVFKYQLK